MYTQQAAWCLLQRMQAKNLPTQYATSAVMKSAAQAALVALKGPAKATGAAKVPNVGNPAIHLPWLEMVKHPTQKTCLLVGMVQITLASFRSDTILQKFNGTKDLDFWRHFPWWTSNVMWALFVKTLLFIIWNDRNPVWKILRTQQQ